MRNRDVENATVLRRLADQALRVAHENPSFYAVDLAEKLYSKAAEAAQTAGNTPEWQRLHRKRNALAGVRTHAIGQETEEESEAQARMVLSRIQEQESEHHPSTGRSSEKTAKKTRLDLILDRVKPRQEEVTIDTEGLRRDQVDRVIATAKERGLDAAYDGRFVLVRDLTEMTEKPSLPPGSRRG